MANASASSQNGCVNSRTHIFISSPVSARFSAFSSSVFHQATRESEARAGEGDAGRGLGAKRMRAGEARQPAEPAAERRSRISASLRRPLPAGRKSKRAACRKNRKIEKSSLLGGRSAAARCVGRASLWLVPRQRRTQPGHRIGRLHPHFARRSANAKPFLTLTATGGWGRIVVAGWGVRARGRGTHVEKRAPGAKGELSKLRRCTFRYLSAAATISAFASQSELPSVDV